MSETHFFRLLDPMDNIQIFFFLKMGSFSQDGLNYARIKTGSVVLFISQIVRDGVCGRKDEVV